VKERARTGKLLIRYVASWPEPVVLRIVEKKLSSYCAISRLQKRKDAAVEL